MAVTEHTKSKKPEELSSDEVEALADRAADGDGQALAILLGVPVDL